MKNDGRMNEGLSGGMMNSVRSCAGMLWYLCSVILETVRVLWWLECFCWCVKSNIQNVQTEKQSLFFVHDAQTLTTKPILNFIHNKENIEISRDISLASFPIIKALYTTSHPKSDLTCLWYIRWRHALWRTCLQLQQSPHPHDNVSMINT